MSLPYFPIYPKNFEAKAGWLSLAQDGAYNRLLRLCWMTPGCSIPADDKWIMARMRVAETQYITDVKPILDEFFRIKRGRYVNDRLSEEFSKAKTKYHNKSKAAKTARSRKALKTKQNKLGKQPYKQGCLEGENQNQNNTPNPSDEGTPAAGFVVSFERFWELYPSGKKRSPERAERAWDALTDDEQQQAISVLPIYSEQLTRDGTTGVTPAVFIRDRWFADIAPPTVVPIPEAGTPEYSLYQAIVEMYDAQAWRNYFSDGRVAIEGNILIARSARIHAIITERYADYLNSRGYVLQERAA